MERHRVNVPTILRRTNKRIKALENDTSQEGIEEWARLLRVKLLAENDFKLTSATHQIIHSVLDKLNKEQSIKMKPKRLKRNMAGSIYVPKKSGWQFRVDDRGAIKIIPYPYKKNI